jgi:alpha-tubulin suppressor-like RCC1 family protein
VSLEQLLGLLRRDQQTVVVVVGAAAVLLSSGAALAFPYGRGSATGSGLTATAIAAGDEHTCALTITAGVKCWGRNDFGQLGNGTTTDRHTPVAVSGLASGVAAIASGGDHVCALTSGGAVKCWGDNARGPLGDGTTTERLTPVAVSGLAGGVASLAAGADHTCALTNAGGVKCWGGNGSGQLGDGTTTTRHLPVDVSGLTSGIAALAAGDEHTCALTSAGAVKCWGGNDTGQLGDGTATERHTPVAVSGLASGVATIAAGVYHTCALTSAGAVKCWGENDFGQLGDGTRTGRRIPVAVSGLAGGVAALVAGGDHTCALMSAGGVKCWGDNVAGQLGDGTTTQRHTPVEVIGAPPPCVVPNVIAKLLPNAKTAIRKAHCSVGKVAYKRSPKAKRNRVMAESPKRGTHLKSGAKVTLTVGRGPTGSNRP